MLHTNKNILEINNSYKELRKIIKKLNVPTGTNTIYHDEINRRKILLTDSSIWTIEKLARIMTSFVISDDENLSKLQIENQVLNDFFGYEIVTKQYNNLIESLKKKQNKDENDKKILKSYQIIN